MYKYYDFIDEMDQVLIERNLQNRRDINIMELEDAVNQKTHQKHQEVMASEDGKTFGEKLEEYNAWLALDLMLLKLERSVGMMDGVPFPPIVKEGSRDE